MNESSLVFKQANPCLISDYINQHVGLHRIQLSGRSTLRSSLYHQKFGELDLCRVRYGGEVQVLSPGLGGDYHAQVILRGSCQLKQEQQLLRYTAGQVFLLNPSDEIDLIYSDDCEKFILKIPQQAFELACADNHWKVPAGGIRFARNYTHLQEISGLAGLLNTLCNEAEAESENLTRQPALYGYYARIIASKLLARLASNIHQESHCPQLAQFDKLTRYIEENIKNDIDIHDLIRQVRSSERSLYALFERYANTSPKNFIKKRKLEHIHQCLSEHARTGRNVTSIALDYGFRHLGRFSESYKEAFGVLPSETLKKSS